METASPKKNRSEMLYYSNTEIKMQIDDVLHQNAMIFQELGLGSTKTAIENAKAQEKRNLKSIRHLDPSFIDGLLYEG
jgi:hypothetical protein